MPSREPPAWIPGRQPDAEPDEPPKIDGIVWAALAHLWFVTIHPFEDRNGRIARALADMSLARSENSPATAQRDLKDLVDRGLLIRNEGGSKNTSYLIARV